MVEMAAAPRVLFPQPNNSIFTVLPFLIAAMGLVLGVSEVRGKNLGYAKFAGDDSKKARVPSKAGMFLLYVFSAIISGAFLAYWIGVLPVLPTALRSCGAADFASLLEQAVAASDTRLLLVITSVFVHFTRRDLECLFVHKFSGFTNLDSLLFIASAYASLVGALLVTQVLSTDLAAPSLDLKWLGFALFLVGTTGNVYHHWLLSTVRKDGGKKYVVPQGGLFGLFVCPHYVFEMITFIGIAFISQTVVGWSVVVVVVSNLIGRTIASKQWYMKKVDGFPKDRSVLIPGVF